MVKRIWRWWLTGLVLFSLLGPVVPERSAPSAAVQPLLVRLAQEDDEALIDVIVQAPGQTAAAQARAIALGGVVTAQLGIIQGFAVTLPAARVAALAQTPGVRAISLDAPVQTSGGPDGAVVTSALANAYNRAIRADKLWAQGYQGSSVTVAVVDSGIADLNDFKMTAGGNGDLRIVSDAHFAAGSDENKDWYGHGTHIAGIIGGNGNKSGGRYIGVAPLTRMVSVDVSDQNGAGTMTDVIEGLQWVLQNKAQHNIRVVNLSLNSAVAESYQTSPLCAAVEILWFNGIVVVVSAGNNGTATLFPPANDPFVITVGAVDDKGTAALSDDVLASFSAYGTDETGAVKPDLVAPGKNIISVLAKPDARIAVQHSDHKVFAFSGSQDYYFRMSGTSMAAPMVTGAVALLLQDEPTLSPDQVKYRLMATANKTWPGYLSTRAGSGYLDVYAAVTGVSSQSANGGKRASQLLWSGAQPVTWTSVNWNSVNWNSVNWNSVNWNSVNWNSVNWNSTYWGP